jgi:hypothetical protein
MNAKIRREMRAMMILHPLSGTWKQRKWAHDIRRLHIGYELENNGDVDKLKSMITDHRDAKWWIENRDSI